jgi:hypothetical protein
MTRWTATEKGSVQRQQADAIAQAILEPDVQVQQALRAKRAREAALDARRRKVALFALIGGGIGAVAAAVSGLQLSSGVLWGALAGAAVRWLSAHRRAD